MVQLTELEANSRHQEAESSNNVREYERALSGVQQEVTAYQTVLAQTQVGIWSNIQTIPVELIEIHLRAESIQLAGG